MTVIFARCFAVQCVSIVSGCNFSAKEKINLACEVYIIPILLSPSNKLPIKSIASLPPPLYLEAMEIIICKSRKRLNFIARNFCRLWFSPDTSSAWLIYNPRNKTVPSYAAFSRSLSSQAPLLLFGKCPAH